MDIDYTDPDITQYIDECRRAPGPEATQTICRQCGLAVKLVARRLCRRCYQRQPDRIIAQREASARYRRNHPEREKARHRRYRQTHARQIKAYSREHWRRYWAEHREEIKAAKARYRATHREEINRKQREYYREHRDRISEQRKKIRQERRAAAKALTASERSRA